MHSENKDKTSNDHHSNFIENSPRHSAVSSLKPSRLAKDIALLNNPFLCISRIYAVFKPLGQRDSIDNVYHQFVLLSPTDLHVRIKNNKS